MNLFSRPQAPTAIPIPTLDDAMQTVQGLKRQSSMQGRAADMLTSGKVTAPTAARTVTGY